MPVYAVAMSEQKRAGATSDGDELVVEFPDDPDLPVMPDASEVHATAETEEPPDTHDIRERWARLADIGGGG